MSRSIVKGSIDQSVDVYIVDSTTGLPETGVLYNTAGMDLKYRREGAAVVNITEVTLASLTAAHSDGGFLEIGNGSYRLDLPDAAVASGADSVLVFGTVTGMIVLPQTIQLTGFDMQTASTPQTGDSYARLGAAGAGLTDLGGMSTTMKGQVNAEADTALSDIHLDHLLATDYDPASKPGTATALLNELVENDGGISRYTANALEQAPSGGGGGGDATAANQTTIINNLATVDTVVDAIKVVTDALPNGGSLTSLATAANLSTVDTVVDAIKVITDALPNNGALTDLAAILAMLDDARAEPGQGTPASNPDLATKVDYLYKAWRNKKTNDGSTNKLYADNGSTVDQKQTTSSAGGTVTKEEWVAGP